MKKDLFFTFLLSSICATARKVEKRTNPVEYQSLLIGAMYKYYLSIGKQIVPQSIENSKSYLYSQNTNLNVKNWNKNLINYWSFMKGVLSSLGSVTGQIKGLPHILLLFFLFNIKINLCEI